MNTGGEAPLVDAELLARLERLTLEWRACFLGIAGGSNSSRHRGSGQEFFDHRHFHVGDDLRDVNWRAYMRFERLFLKMFQLEPRVPIRVLLDASASMTAGCGLGEAAKFDCARRLAAALIYIALVQLASGGRSHFAPVEARLRGLKASGRTNFAAVVREYLEQHPQPGLAIVISDFLDDSGSLQPLAYLSSFGHEIMLVQIWSEEDRLPTGEGELELIHSETGAVMKMALDEGAREAHARAFDHHTNEIRAMAVRNGGRYASISTKMRLEEAIFGPLALRYKF